LPLGTALASESAAESERPLMKESHNGSLDIREAGRSDDEITLPLRIVCERRPDRAPVNSGDPKLKNARDRDHKEAQKPVRVA
jgi:hypothetical protein